MEKRFESFETLKPIDKYEMKNAMTDEKRRALFERRMPIFFQIPEWPDENKKFGLEPAISDTWTPEQGKKFLRDWLDDSVIMEAIRGKKHTYDEMMNEEPSTSHHLNEGASTSQTSRGEKRSHNEVCDDDEDDERPYVIEVNIDKFRIKGTNYTL